MDALNQFEKGSGFRHFPSRRHCNAPIFSLHRQYVHCLGNSLPGSIRIAEGLYVGGDFELLKTLINNGHVQESQIKFFLGYSGWSEGQLNSEIDQKIWIVSKTNHNFIFEEQPDGMWTKQLRSMGGRYRIKSNYPIDPRLN